MQIYVGVTDFDWYTQLSNAQAYEVNFWKPGTKQSFKSLQENEMFLFKLHSPLNYIVGGGFFVKYSVLPTFLAWQAFDKKNGVQNLAEFNRRIDKYRGRNDIDSNPEVGCIILTDCFWFKEDEWIPIPEDWKSNIVSGKLYKDDNPYTAPLFKAVQDHLSSHSVAQNQTAESDVILLHDNDVRYTTTMTKHRLGQGAFRVAVTDAYQRRCAITGEKTLPVLEAAHIKPYAEDGPHSVNNGILLKSDYHTLYDAGYITITPDLHIEVSGRLHNDYGNGKDYYKHHGERLLILPEDQRQLPAKEFLQWHNENVFLG